MSGVIAFIPAKSVSRRVTKKNMRMVGERPLFLHSVDFALEADFFTAVYVSSDSDEIVDIAKNNGVYGVKRDSQLCDHKTTNHEVIRDFLLALYEKNRVLPDVVVLLQPTHPFRSKSETEKALKEFIASDYSSYRPVQYVKTVDEDTMLPTSGRNMDLGFFYMFKPQLEELNETAYRIWGENPGIFQVQSDYYYLNIDNELELKVAQHCHEHIRNHNR